MRNIDEMQHANHNEELSHVHHKEESQARMKADAADRQVLWDKLEN